MKSEQYMDVMFILCSSAVWLRLGRSGGPHTGRNAAERHVHDPGADIAQCVRGSLS